jgi:acyl carrier protein
MEETRKVFHAEVPGHGKHFLRTGDLGFMHDGQLYVTGRVKDVIIIRGRNHYPQDIEQTVEQAHPAILPGAAFSMQVDDTEQLAVVHQVDRQSRGEDWEKVASSVRRAIVANHDLDPQRIVFIRQTSLPITSSGKVQRSLCRQQLIADELKVVHDWTAPQRTASRNGDHDQSATTNGSANGHVANGRANGNGKGSVEINVSGDGVSWKQNGNGHAAAPSTPTSGSQARAALNGLHTDRAAERIESWLLQWLVERVGLDPVDVDRTKPFAEFGVDSVTSVELSQELEDEFGIELTPVVAWNHPTPAALSRYLAEQIATVNSAINGAATNSSATNGAATYGAVVTNGTVTNGSTLNGSAGNRLHHRTNGHHLGNGSTNGAANRLADDDLQKMLAEVENLSDDEVARLLAEED